MYEILKKKAILNNKKTGIIPVRYNLRFSKSKQILLVKIYVWSRLKSVVLETNNVGDKRISNLVKVLNIYPNVY